MANTRQANALAVTVRDWLRGYLRRRGGKVASGWTVTDLAKASNVARATLQRWLAGLGEPESDKVLRVAKVLGVDPPPAFRESAGDPGVTPPAYASGPLSSGVAEMVAQAVAAVIEQAIQLNEMHGTREGIEAVAKGLIAFAKIAQAAGADVSKVLLLAIRLRDGEP